jgi:hypothetical protein
MTRRKFLVLTGVVVCASVLPVAHYHIKRNPKRRAWRRRKNKTEDLILDEMMRDARDIRRLKK